MAICYIVGAGDFEGKITPTESDLVIAADGGYDHLRRAGVRVDLLIGDLDSIESVPEGIELIKFPTKKDYTDTYLAYFEGAARGYTEFRIYGGCGGRDDHTFVNISLLAYIRNRGGRATLFSKAGTITAIKNESVTVLGEKEKHISLFAFGSAATGVCIRGLEYECDGITLTPEFPLGASNRFLDTPAEISVADGMLLIMQEI